MTDNKKIEWVPDKKIDYKEVEYILKQSENLNKFTNYGPCVIKLENIIKDKLIIDDTKSIIAVNSGTGALHALVSGIELYLNKKLNWVTQSYTFPPSAQGPLSQAEIIDIDDEGGLDISKIPDDTEGIIVTNIFGNVVNINKYINYCKKKNIILLFDNAATSFTFYNNINSINYGIGSIISFHHTKPMGFGEGGAIIVDKCYEKSIRCIMNFGINNGKDYFLREASNYKMSDISAAFIIQYLNNFDSIVAIHKKLFKYMENRIKNIKDITLYPNFSSDTPFLSCFCLLFENYNDEIRIKLLENNIFCRKYYNPLKNTPKTIEIYNKILCIPCTKDMTEEDINEIINLIVFV